MTLGITYWAAGRTKSASDFYTAGGGITGFQNGLAIAGDYMSAATLLGLTALVYTKGVDGYIYMIAFFAGWPIILFLMAERLRNLGKYTFADVASYRLKQTSVRSLSASGSLVVVALYLIAQMVGAGKLIELLFGLQYHVAVVLVGILMVLYVLFGGMLATTWVQIIKAVMLLSGASFMAIMVMKSVNFDIGALFSGIVGWCDSQGNGEWAVVIRCGVLDGHQVELFAGAGIVAGSDPAMEWAETGTKLGTMLKALGLGLEVAQ